MKSAILDILLSLLFLFILFNTTLIDKIHRVLLWCPWLMKKSLNPKSHLKPEWHDMEFIPSLRERDIYIYTCIYIFCFIMTRTRLLYFHKPSKKYSSLLKWHRKTVEIKSRFYCVSPRHCEAGQVDENGPIPHVREMLDSCRTNSLVSVDFTTPSPFPISFRVWCNQTLKMHPRSEIMHHENY